MSRKNQKRNPDSDVRKNKIYSENYSGILGINIGSLSLILILAVMVLAVIITAGCTGNGAGDVPDDSGDMGYDDKITGSENGPENATSLSGYDLSGTGWFLTSYMKSSGEMTTEVPLGAGATLTFVNDSILGGNSGCNSYSADYTAEDGEFKTGIVVLTAMYCTDATMEFEDNYLELLQKGRSIGMSADNLIISDENGNVILTFSPFVLSGSSWELTSMNDGKEAVVSLPENIGITIEFSDDKASGNAGCNNYFSSYSTGEDFGIEFSAIGSTKMYCEENIMVYESAYLKNLELVSEYDFNGKSLVLRDNDGKILMTFAKSG